MLYFRKNRIKLSLIKDYAFLLVVKNFCNNFENTTINFDQNLFQSLKEQNQNLYNTYNFLFEKLKMNDLSLLILRKEIKDDNSIFLTEEHRNFKTTNNTLKALSLKHEFLQKELKNKINDLKLNLNLSV